MSQSLSWPQSLQCHPSRDWMIIPTHHLCSCPHSAKPKRLSGDGHFTLFMPLRLKAFGTRLTKKLRRIAVNTFFFFNGAAKLPLWQSQRYNNCSAENRWLRRPSQYSGLYQGTPRKWFQLYGTVHYSAGSIHQKMVIKGRTWSAVRMWRLNGIQLVNVCQEHSPHTFTQPASVFRCTQKAIKDILGLVCW